MSAITLQTITAAGITPSYQAATASDTVAGATGDDTIFIHAKNTNAAAATVTIAAVQSSARVTGIGTLTVPNIAVTIPATTGDKLIGPIPAAYIDGTGTITLANTGTITNLTLAAIRLPRASV